MARREPPSTRAKLNAVALATTAAGIVLQIAAGSELYPPIPPGPVILLAGAGVVAFGPWRWTAIVGLAVPVVLTVGGIVAALAGNEFLDQLTQPAGPGIFAGTLIQLIGQAAALVTGMVLMSRRSSLGAT